MPSNTGRYLFFMILGQSCNLNCKYCIKADDHSKDVTTINPDIYKFFKSEKINSNTIQAITFYGGEPLVYFDKMKTIIDTFNDPTLKFSTMTNGLLLTKDIVNYINTKNMSVNVSWDGPHSEETRGIDVFKVNKDNILNLRNMWVTSVLSTKAYPLEVIDSINVLEEEYKLRNQYHFPVFFNPAIRCSDHEIFSIDTDRLYNEMTELMNCDDDNVAASMVRNWEYSHCKQFLNSNRKAIKRCGAGYSMMALDMNGSIYLCKNSPVRIGDIYTPFKEIKDKTLDLDIGVPFDKCAECEVKSVCRAGCRIIKKEYQDEFCDIQKAYALPIVEYTRFKIESEKK